MMYHTSHLFKNLLVILALAAFGVACDGPVGPQGDTGPAGPEGPQGPQGEEGTANVIYSDWMTVNWNGVDNPDFKRMDIDEPRALEPDVMDEGTILVYMSQQSSAGVFVLAIPAVIGNSSLYHAIADLDDGTTTIQGIAIVNRSTDTNPVDDLAGNEVRYVLIPGGAEIPALRAGFRTDLDLSDYEAVAAYYGIPNDGAGQITPSR